MIKSILTYPKDKEILTQKSIKVASNDETVQELIDDLIDTLKSTDGCGISAVQIGDLRRVCIVKYNNNYIAMINPVITKKRGEILFKEGCLSAPGVYKTVTRSQKVWCTYIDKNGKECEIAQGGLCSVIIQHELDHLDGWCQVFEAVE